MNHNSASQNTVFTDQLDMAVADFSLGVTLGVGLEVSEVADVAF